jgi:hypothetical protein
LADTGKSSVFKKQVAKQQLENGEETHLHHVVSKKHGGTDDLVNLRLVHHNCHRQTHSNQMQLEVRQLLEPDTRRRVRPVLRGGRGSNVISLIS